MLSVAPRRFVLPAVAAVFVLATAGNFLIVAVDVHAPNTVERLLKLSAYFCAGAMLYLLRQKIPFSTVFIVGAAALVVVTVLTGTFEVLAGLPLAYLMLALSILLPLQKIGARNDISYGMYIYGFPMQQLLFEVFPRQQLPVWLFVALGLAITTPFAWASWLLIERQAMRLKWLTARPPIDREGHVRPVEARVSGEP